MCIPPHRQYTKYATMNYCLYQCGRASGWQGDSGGGGGGVTTLGSFRIVDECISIYMNL